MVAKELLVMGVILLVILGASFFVLRIFEPEVFFSAFGFNAIAPFEAILPDFFGTDVVSRSASVEVFGYCRNGCFSERIALPVTVKITFDKRNVLPLQNIVGTFRIDGDRIIDWSAIDRGQHGWTRNLRFGIFLDGELQSEIVSRGQRRPACGPSPEAGIVWGDFCQNMPFNFPVVDGGSHIVDVRVREHDVIVCSSGTCTTRLLSDSESVWLPLISASFYKESDLCAPTEGFLVASERFSSNFIVSSDVLRFPPEAYCRLLPIIKLKPNEPIDSSVSEYSILQAGGSYQIPEGEVHDVRFIIRANSQLQLLCSDLNGSYDVENNSCTPDFGFASICSQGQFDVFRGICVTQPFTPCDRGFLVGDKCIYNPPQNFDCQRGIYMVDTERCEYESGTIGVCFIGSDWDESRNVCQYEPRVLCNPYLRSEFNIEKGKCEFNPEKLGVCPEGRFYNFEQNYCQPVASDSPCADGYSFNEAEEICEGLPLSSDICAIGFTFNSEIAVCEQIPPAFRLCPEGYEYDSETGECFQDVEVPDDQIIEDPVPPPTDNGDIVIIPPPVPPPPVQTTPLIALELFLEKNLFGIVIGVILFFVVLGGIILLNK